MTETGAEDAADGSEMPEAGMLASRLFSLVMAGVMAVILLMAVASDW